MAFRGVGIKKWDFLFLAKSITDVNDFGSTSVCCVGLGKEQNMSSARCENQQCDFILLTLISPLASKLMLKRLNTDIFKCA